MWAVDREAASFTTPSAVRVQVAANAAAQGVRASPRPAPGAAPTCLMVQQPRQRGCLVARADGHLEVWLGPEVCLLLCALCLKGASKRSAVGASSHAAVAIHGSVLQGQHRGAFRRKLTLTWDRHFCRAFTNALATAAIELAYTAVSQRRPEMLSGCLHILHLHAA